MKTITIIIILTIFCVTPLHPIICMNYFCYNLIPQCPEASNTQPPNTPQDVDQYQNENLAYLQAKAAANFFEANGHWNIFLSKIEMIGVSRVEYIELNNILKKTVLKIEEAEKILTRISIASRQYQVNPSSKEKLTNFDYKYFSAKHNLNTAVMSEIECSLNNGDILGIPNRLREQITDLKIQLEGFRQTIEQKSLDIDSMYGINQNLLTLALWGQYTAMIFREVRKQ